ncbi:MAG: hypothetical protein K6F14_04595 [Clostridiales bacterium]|nr:hypothetical protein [Clostridiales bacterium]
MKKIIAVLLLICFCIGIAACQSNNDNPVITLGSKTTESTETEMTAESTTLKDTTEHLGTIVTETDVTTTKPDGTTKVTDTTTSKVTETTKNQETTTETSVHETTESKDPSVTTEETTREDPFIHFNDIDSALTFYADEVMGKRIEDPYTFILIKALYDANSKSFKEEEVNTFDYWIETINDNAKRSLVFESAPVLNLSDKLIIQYDEATLGATRQDAGTAIISSVYVFVYDDSAVAYDFKDISNGDGIERIDLASAFEDTGYDDLYVVVKVTQFGDTYRVGGEYKTEYIDYFAIICVHNGT